MSVEDFHFGFPEDIYPPHFITSDCEDESEVHEEDSQKITQDDSGEVDQDEDKLSSVKFHFCHFLA